MLCAKIEGSGIRYKWNQGGKMKVLEKVESNKNGNFESFVKLSIRRSISKEDLVYINNEIIPITELYYFQQNEKYGLHICNFEMSKKPISMAKLIEKSEILATKTLKKFDKNI
jgi:hypothetical protein